MMQMANRCERDMWERFIGESLHPGGLAQTRRLIERASLSYGSRILDVGCGKGQTVALLRQMGFKAYGIDCSKQLVESALKSNPDLDIQVSSGENLPFPNEIFTCVIMECSLSGMDSARTLIESFRVLEHGGILIICDIYTIDDLQAREYTKENKGSKQYLTKSGWLSCIESAGYRIISFEDRSDDLESFSMKMLWEDTRQWGDCLKLFSSRNIGYMQILAQKPSVESGSNVSPTQEDSIIGETWSVCPECLAQIRAFRVKRGNEVYLTKTCEKHGSFEALIWEDASSFESWVSIRYSNAMDVEDKCLSSCIKCDLHLSRPCCVLLQVTDRCNLSCPVCFASSECYLKESGNPSLEEIAGWYEMLLERAGKVNIQLSGGEPTLREDLEEIIAVGRARGFSYFQLNTNGLRIANEGGYAQRLKDAGLSCVFLQFDGVDDETYKILRGRGLLEEKMKAIRYCEEAHLPVVLVPTIVRGVNDDELGDIVSLGVKHAPTVRGVHIQPVSYFGRVEGIGRGRISIPGILQRLECQTGGMIQIGDFSGGSAEHPWCSFNGYYRIGEGDVLEHVGRKISDHCCDAARFNNLIKKEDSLEVNEDPVSRAQKIVKLRWGADIGSLPASPSNGSLDEFLYNARKKSFSITGMAFQDAWTLDEARLRHCHIFVVDRRCAPIPFCAYNLSSCDGTPNYRRGETLCDA